MQIHPIVIEQVLIQGTLPRTRDTKINMVQPYLLKDPQLTGRGRGYMMNKNLSGCKSCHNSENKALETKGRE